MKLHISLVSDAINRVGCGLVLIIELAKVERRLIIHCLELMFIKLIAWYQLVAACNISDACGVSSTHHQQSRPNENGFRRGQRWVEVQIRDSLVAFEG